MVSQLILTDAPDLPKITSAVLVESFESIRSSLVSLERAFAVSKIVERVILEEMNQQSIFQLTLDTLVRLNDDLPWENVWLYFLGRLTNHLGLALSDYACERCTKTIDEAAWWQPSERRFVCQKCRQSIDGAIFCQANSVKLLRLLQNQPYAMIERLRFGQIVGQQTEEVLLREVTEWFNKSWTSYANLRTAHGSAFTQDLDNREERW
jgi:DNA repair protein RecO